MGAEAIFQNKSTQRYKTEGDITIMISCHYCNASYEAFQSICSACGAPLRVDESASTEKTDAQIITEKIRRLCRQNIFMYNISMFQLGDSISEKKIRTIVKSFSVFPNGKEIYFYCDTSPLNNGKQGFMICEDGIYWQNSWFKPTKRNFLPWDRFKEREITLKKYDLDLGAGDIISLAGLGRKPLFTIVEGIFHHIQKILQGNK